MSQIFQHQEPPGVTLSSVNSTQPEEHAQSEEQAVLPHATGKRIVSKRVYATRQAMRMWMGLVGVCMLLGVLVPVLYIGFSFLRLGLSPENAWYMLLSLALFLPIVFSLGRQASRGLRAAIRSDPGVPLTRANTGDLPAQESLVRASAEPLQEQQAVLLRAAMTSEQTPPEQLVRPANGTE